MYSCRDRGCASINREKLEDYVEEVMICWLSHPDVYAALTKVDDSKAAAQARADANRARADLDELYADVEGWTTRRMARPTRDFAAIRPTTGVRHHARHPRRPGRPRRRGRSGDAPPMRSGGRWLSRHSAETDRLDSWPRPGSAGQERTVRGSVYRPPARS
jgi:hypothetical protein